MAKVMVREDPLVAARQHATRNWWQVAAANYRVLISQLVLDECAGGDPVAATERLDAIKEIDLIDSSDDVDMLAEALIAGNAIPSTEPRDAFHIAISAVNGIVGQRQFHKDSPKAWKCLD